MVSGKAYFIMVAGRHACGLYVNNNSNSNSLFTPMQKVPPIPESNELNIINKIKEINKFN